MGEFSAAGTAVAFAPVSGPALQWDTISHFAPPEGLDFTRRFRFVPLSCLVNCSTEWDAGIDSVVYLQSFIEEEE